MALLTSFHELAETLGSWSQDLERFGRDIEAGNAAGAADQYLDLWQEVHSATDAIRVAGLSEITEFVCFNARSLVDACHDGRMEPARIRALEGALPVLRRFLESPMDADSLGELITYLQQSDWPTPMGDDQAYTIMGRLLEQLQDIGQDDTADGSDAHSSGTESSPTDYDLVIPDDTHPQLVEAFFNEVPQLAEEFGQCVQRLTGSDGNRDDLVKAQRLSHTIKGSANITGVRGVATLMHGCEGLLETLYQHHTTPDTPLSEVLVETADCLAAQLEHLQGGGPAPTQARSLVEAMQQWHIDGAVNVPAGAALEESAVDGVTEAPRPEASSQTESLRVSAARIEDLLRQAGEVSIATVQLLGLSQVLGNRLDILVKQQSELWERLNTIQELVEVRGSSMVKNVAGEPARASEFDSLEMDEYNELYSATSFLAESIMDSREYTNQIREDFNRMRSMLKQQDLLSRELSENVMGTRMIPFNFIRSRLERVVRQTSRSTGKAVELSIEGDDVPVDRTVLDRLTDPLMHLLRNAVDHGLEEKHERLAAGKSETGHINIRVTRHGDNVSLTITDDGRGLDYAAIRRAGLQRGLIDDESTTISNEELTRFVLLPGFSTRSEATQISGRGIGMDVVNTAVIEQRGTVDIRSEPGAGIEIQIRVPMTLISVHTLLLRNEGVLLGVPSSSVQQLIFSDLGQWRRETDGELVFEFENRDHRVVTLSSLVGLETPGPGMDEPKPLPLLLVQGEREPYAVILEEMLDNRYLVVKRLGRYVPRIQGVIGGSILGDGSVAAVVDIRELLRHQSDVNAARLRDIGQQSRAEAGRELPSVLVVDDSVSTRRALSELVSDAGYRSETAIDGVDALDKIRREKPAAILVDMEMPRMNGIELTAHLRGDTSTADIPMIMITSRSADKHQRQAKHAGVDRYFTKPYHEDDLVAELHALIR